RAAHPLYTLLQPKRVPDMINTMLNIYDEQGCLPVWHLYGSDTHEMIGIQSVPVIADAVGKGFPGIDPIRALNAMKQSMLSDYKGLGWLRTQNYIPSDKEGESVAKGLEYALADGSVALVARKLGRDEDARLFDRRARFYASYWDADRQFFRGRRADGSFSEPFDPFHSTHRNDDYCEGTGWQYTWLVPHDVQGLISLFGGDAPFLDKLDRLFTVEGDMGMQASGDISGLIGQYAHGNEPGHHTAYLYAYAGQQWKTAHRVRQILNLMYTDQSNGLAGNEDCGQISSWYVFSAMGFYPVNASLGVYVLGSPKFERMTIRFDNGKRFTVQAVNNSEENIYIQSATLNGMSYPYTFIRHSDLLQGGTLRLVMGAQPNKTFGASPAYRPIEQ
ncbi:MAG: glycoside hydrolase family 92 protein, partial [Alistipes sp.]